MKNQAIILVLVLVGLTAGSEAVRQNTGSLTDHTVRIIFKAFNKGIVLS